jgi:cell division septation protein DedD
MAENTKKFLWLAGAVSLFALLVIGAAFLLFTPKKASSQVPFDLKGTAEPKQESPQDFLADAPADTGTTQTTSSSGDVIIVYGNNPDTKSSAAPAEAQQKPASTTIVVAPPATPTTIKPASTPKAGSSTPKASAAVPAAKTVVQPSANPAAKAVVKAPAVPATPAATVPSTPAPAKPAAPKPVVQVAAGDYWIQAGSFSVKDNADALKSSLKEKALPTTISVRDTDGKSRYLVKIGPYTTREEAGKWLPSVKSVKGAEKAWITQ